MTLGWLSSLLIVVESLVEMFKWLDFLRSLDSKEGLTPFSLPNAPYSALMRQWEEGICGSVEEAGVFDMELRYLENLIEH